MNSLSLLFVGACLSGCATSIVGDSPLGDAAASSQDAPVADARISAIDAALTDARLPDAHSAGCNYEKVFDQPGHVLTVVDGASKWSTQPVQSGEGFFCLRFEFTMQTSDTLAQTQANYEGCPIFTAIGRVQGTTEQLAGGLFKFLDVGCDPGPHRVEIDTWVENAVVAGPWNLGETYRVVIEVVPFVASIELFQGGVQVGPTVSASVDGTSVEMTRDGVVSLGQEAPADGAYFPNYGAVYSDVQVWAHVAPAE